MLKFDSEEQFRTTILLMGFDAVAEILVLGVLNTCATRWFGLNVLAIGREYLRNPRVRGNVIPLLCLAGSIKKSCSNCVESRRSR